MILAIIPVLPFLALLGLAGGGGLLAWFKLRKSKKTDDTLQIPPAGGGGGSASVETGDVPMIEFREVSDGETDPATARLEKKGATWTYRVTGREAATGGNADAGKALVEMSQAFANAMRPGEISEVTGWATSPTNQKLAFSVTNNQDLWDWIVTTAAPIPSPMPGVPAAPKVIADGYEESRSRAALQMMLALTQNLDWLGVVPNLEEGSGAPPVPTPDPAPQLPGIKVTGKNLGVTNLSAWVAYAAPHMREHFAQGHTADEIMDAEHGVDLPDDVKIQGKSIATVRAALQKIVDDIQAKTYIGTSSPEQRAAAAVVGSDFGVTDVWVGPYKNHVILVRRSKPQGGGGGLANPNPPYEYMIWTGGMRGYEEDVAERKVMTAGLTKTKTVNAARARIDAELGDPAFDPLVLVDAGLVDLLPDPLVLVNTGLIDIKAVDYGARKKLTVNAPTWRSRSTTDITIFDFAKGELSKRKDWTIGIAICITTDMKLPFGSLTSQLDGKGQVGSGSGFGSGSSFGDPMSRFMLADMEGRKIADLSDFKNPLAFKGQFLGKFERGATVRITKPLEDITGSDAGEEYDPCKKINYRWPTPTDGNSFLVQPAGEQYMSPWDAVPRLKMIVQGPKILLRVTYSGFPLFVDVEGGESPALVTPAKLKLDVKVWASGINL